MELLKKKCEKAGYERYMNYYLTWSHNGVNYRVAVRPVSPKLNKVLYAKAKEEKRQMSHSFL